MKKEYLSQTLARLTLRVTKEQHKKIKKAALEEDMTIQTYLAKKIFGRDVSEKKD